MPEKERKKQMIGDDSVVYGNVTADVGNRSVVIGPTDGKRNVILNKGMAIGFNAQAGPNSIAIGAFASAGLDIRNTFSEIEGLIRSSNNRELEDSFEELCDEIGQQEKNISRIHELWRRIEVSPIFSGAVKLLTTASGWIFSLT